MFASEGKAGEKRNDQVKKIEENERGGLGG